MSGSGRLTPDSPASTNPPTNYRAVSQDLAGNKYRIRLCERWVECSSVAYRMLHEEGNHTTKDRYDHFDRI